MHEYMQSQIVIHLFKFFRAFAGYFFECPSEIGRGIKAKFRGYFLNFFVITKQPYCVLYSDKIFVVYGRYPVSF